jgi:hypothetical protein
MIEAAMVRTLPGLLVAVVVGAAPAPALGQPAPPPPLPGVPAVDQYREALPTAAGPVAAGQNAPRITPLPLAIERLVSSEGGTDAPLLERVATSSDYGAPPARSRIERPSAGSRSEPAGAPLPPASLTRGAGAAGHAFLDRGARGVLLVGLMIGIAAAVGAASRRGSRPT